MNPWPQGMTLRPIVTWPDVMTKTRKESPFSAPMRSTLSQLQIELRHVKARDVVMQIALEESQFRQDGYPRATAIPSHPGVILSMNTPDGPLSFPCDTFRTWPDNLRAIVLTMERLRAVGRYGVTKHAEQYTFWKALDSPTPADPSFTSVDDALSFLKSVANYSGDEPIDEAALIRRAKRKAHPDHDGSSELFQRVAAAEAFLKAN